ncbi:MAG: hypothetical protein EGP87_09065 [Paraprevotella clara]|nr:hypothetical protein [Paraprevotella clara]
MVAQRYDKYPRRYAYLHYLCYHEDRMRLGIAKPENFVFICLCARLSLSLYTIGCTFLWKQTVTYTSKTWCATVASWSYGAYWNVSD